MRMKEKKILIVDDDINIGNLLQEVLVKQGAKVLRAYSGTEAVLLLSSEQPDLVLLDLMLPGLNGEEVLPYIKDVPVIVLSAKAAVEHKVELLLNGAADYVTKPFEVSELLARIVVQLRGAKGRGEKETLCHRQLSLDASARQVSVDGCFLHLTPTEYAILKLLMQNPSQVIPKSLLLERIAEETEDCTESSLKVHISNLRRKLKEVNGEDYIESVWGIGFKMKEP